VNRLVVSTDDRLAATTPVSYSPGPRVRSCHVVDLLTGAVSATFSSDPGGTFHSAVFSNDSTRFYLGNSDTIRVFDTESWEEMDRLVRPEPPHDGGSFTGLLPVAENHSVLITRSDGELVLWTPGESFPAWTGSGHLLFVHEITGDANGQQFFTQGFDRTVRLWKIDRETPLLTFPLDPLVQRSDRYGLALSHSGNRLAAIEGPQQIKILTAADDDKVELNLSVPTP